MEQKLFDILVCPICKSMLQYDSRKQDLICKVDRLAFPIEDDIPIMLEDRAKKLTLEEIEELR